MKWFLELFLSIGKIMFSLGNVASILATKTAPVRLLDDPEIAVLNRLENSLIQKHNELLLRISSLEKRLQQTQDKAISERYAVEMKRLGEEANRTATLMRRCWRIKVIASFRKNIEQIIANRPIGKLPNDISLIQDFNGTRIRYHQCRREWEQYHQYLLQKSNWLPNMKAPIELLDQDPELEKVIQEKDWAQHIILSEISQCKKRIEGLIFMEEWCLNRALINQDEASDIQDRLASINEVQKIDLLLPEDFSMPQIEAAINNLDKIEEAEAEVNSICRKFLERKTDG